jgi:hypothetical protein
MEEVQISKHYTSKACGANTKYHRTIWRKGACMVSYTKALYQLQELRDELVDGKAKAITGLCKMDPEEFFPKHLGLNSPTHCRPKGKVSRKRQQCHILEVHTCRFDPSPCPSPCLGRSWLERVGKRVDAVYHAVYFHPRGIRHSLLQRW